MDFTNWHSIVGILAGISTILAYIPNVYCILKKKIRPTMATWIIWMISSILLLASYGTIGAKETLWVPIGYLVGNTITLSALIYSRVSISWTKLDSVCLTIAIASIVPWFMFDEPLATLLILLTMDLIGSFPTIKKVYYQPWTEDKLTWLLFGLGFIFNLLAVDRFNLTLLSYPAFMVVVGGSISLFVLWDRGRKPPVSK